MLKDKTNMDQTEFIDLDKTTKKEVNLNNGNPNNENSEIKYKNIFQRFFNFFTVEPFLLCYLMPSIISSLAIQKFNLEKACLADLNYSEEICTLTITGNFDENNTDANTASELSQTLVAEMTAWSTPIQSGIPAIVILFVGAWSDRTGNRKALMMVPLFGEIISSIGMLLTVYYFLEWPLWITGLIEAVPSAFTGGRSIALMGAFSYIADVTTLESRTFRIGFVGVIVSLGFPLATSISGVLTEAVGYYGIFGIGLAMNICGFLYSYFTLHDVRRIETDKFTILSFFNPKNVIDTLSLLVRNKKGKRLLVIWLVIWAHIVILGPVYGESAIMFLYTLRRYSMDLIEFSLFTTYSVLIGICGTAIAITVFSKLLKMHDALIGIIATTCKVASSILYGLAPTKAWFYAGPVVDIFGNVGVTAIRSLGTKIVEPGEVGKMCSIIGLAEAIVPVVYTPLYSLVYANTLDSFIGAFYILGGLMTVPAWFIFIFIYITQKKKERDIVKDPITKDAYARDNEITSL